MSETLQTLSPQCYELLSVKHSFITFYITFTSFIYIPAAVMLANRHNMEQSLGLTVNVGIKLNVRLSSNT